MKNRLGLCNQTSNMPLPWPWIQQPFKVSAPVTGSKESLLLAILARELASNHLNAFKINHSPVTGSKKSRLLALLVKARLVSSSAAALRLLTPSVVKPCCSGTLPVASRALGSAPTYKNV